jgi:hypothetical protein
MFAHTQYDLWLLLRGGASVQQWQDALKALELRLLEKRLNIRLMICSPFHNPTVEMVAKRREKPPRTNARTESDIVAAITEIVYTVDETNRQKTDNFSTLEVKTIKYMPSALLYISDALEKDDEVGKAVALFSNFRGNLVDAPMIVASKKDNREMFDYFVRDYERLWSFGALENIEKYRETEG